MQRLRTRSELEAAGITGLQKVMLACLAIGTPPSDTLASYRVPPRDSGVSIGGVQRLPRNGFGFTGTTPAEKWT